MGRFGLPDGCPSAAGNLKVLELSHPYHYALTDVGTLASLGGAYEIDLDLGDFCVDFLWPTDETAALVPVAVICDPCSSRICLPTCCHHFQYAAKGLFTHSQWKLQGFPSSFLSCMVQLSTTMLL